MSSGEDAQVALPQIERFVRQLVAASKAVMLYPPASDIPLRSADEAIAALREALAVTPEVILAVSKHGLFFGDLQILPKQEGVTAFALELYNRKLALVRFDPDVTDKELIEFLAVLKQSPDELRTAGGFEAAMASAQIDTVSVVEAQVTLVEQAVEPEESDGVSLETQDLGADSRSSAARRANISIERLIGDDSAVMSYLSRHSDADGGEIPLSTLSNRFAELAVLVSQSSSPAGDKFVSMFAQALWAMEPHDRQQMLETEMLPQARSNAVLAGTIRRIDVTEITRMLAQGEEAFEKRRSGFTLGLRNLVQVTHHPREEIASAAVAAMAEAGASEQTIQEVIAEGAPERVTYRGRPLPAQALGAEASLALQLINHAPLARLVDPGKDPEVAALQSEAALGVTDLDMISSLLTLIDGEQREHQFANTMAVLEDTLGVLVSRGEYETASEAAMLMMQAAHSPRLNPEQRLRVERGVGRFARPEDIREIVQTLRSHQPGQSEYDAAERLLNVLGSLAIHPLLELLADEQDRAERKALVDLISRNAEKYITDLATHMSDNRWFFVRNVVAILGTTRSPAALGALERTLRHHEPRVRRETIRALSLIQDRMADEMLIAALSDDDGNNVRQAARYLGIRGMRNAVYALEQVAKGEGRGNRDMAPRLEAIEALAKIGGAETIPVLQAVGRRRGLIGGGQKAKDLRAAAQAAIAAIKAKGGGPNG